MPVWGVRKRQLEPEATVPHQRIPGERLNREEPRARSVPLAVMKPRVELPSLLAAPLPRPARRSERGALLKPPGARKSWEAQQAPAE